MAPCEVEFRLQGQEKWVKFPTVKPRDPPGSISDISGSQRDIYFFECEKDDSQTTIYRSGFGRVIHTDLEKLEIVDILKKGESFELKVTTERGLAGTFRFFHK